MIQYKFQDGERRVPMTHVEEGYLPTLVRNGITPAMHELWRRNKGFVIRFLHVRRGLMEQHGLEFEEMLHEMYVANHVAALRYLDGRAKFKTYAEWWMRRAFTVACDATTGESHGTQSRFRQAGRVAREFLQIKGREATDEELAESLAVPVKTAAYLRVKPRVYGSLDKVNTGTDRNPCMVEEYGLRPVNAVEHYRSDQGMYAPDDPEPTAEDLALANVDQRLLARIRARTKLSMIEAMIITRRFGFDGEPERTFREIGDEFGLSRERIRQIERSALRKFRASLCAIENGVPELVRKKNSDLLPSAD